MNNMGINGFLIRYPNGLSILYIILMAMYLFNRQELINND